MADTGLDAYNGAFAAFSRFKADFQKFFTSHRYRWHRVPEGWLKYNEIPRLHFFSLRIDDVLNNAMFDILIIVVYNILFFMLSFLAFLLYDPR